MKTFFGLHFICLREKNSARHPLTPRLKIGINWSKIANYTPNAQHKSAPLNAKLNRPTPSTLTLKPLLFAKVKTNNKMFKTKSLNVK